ncbi:hypothetical protein ACEQ8H_008312 [Pleosporales sp. CAS-2024a]
MSFVSPISETSRRRRRRLSAPHDAPPQSQSQSRLARISTYLKNAVTLEDAADAVYRESLISDRGNAQHEALRRASIASLQDERDDRALLHWRRTSEEAFWKKYGVVGAGREEE